MNHSNFQSLECGKWYVRDVGDSRDGDSECAFSFSADGVIPAAEGLSGLFVGARNHVGVVPAGLSATVAKFSSLRLWPSVRIPLCWLLST